MTVYVALLRGINVGWTANAVAELAEAIIS
jgi:uncharacterized protein (DUF1697 family)